MIVSVVSRLFSALSHAATAVLPLERDTRKQQQTGHFRFGLSSIVFPSTDAASHQTAGRLKGARRYSRRNRGCQMLERGVAAEHRCVLIEQSGRRSEGLNSQGSDTALLLFGGVGGLSVLQASKLRVR